MSESEIMFNERDRRCAAVQRMLSTDPSYDKTIASTLNMQIRMVQRLRAQLNASDDPLEVVEWKDTARKTQTKEFIEKVQAIIDETPQQPIRQIARDLGIAHITKMHVWRRTWSVGCQKSQILIEKTKNLRLIKSVRHPLLPRPEPAGLLRLVICREHHKHDLPLHQSQLDCRHCRVFAELSPALVEKACSQFWIRIEAVIEAEGGYIE